MATEKTVFTVAHFDICSSAEQVDRSFRIGGGRFPSEWLLDLI